MSIWLLLQRRCCSGCTDGIPYATSWVTTERPHVLPGYGRQAIPLPCTTLIALRRKFPTADRLIDMLEALDRGEPVHIDDKIAPFIGEIAPNVCMACGNIAGPYWCSHCGAT